MLEREVLTGNQRAMGAVFLVSTPTPRMCSLVKSMCAESGPVHILSVYNKLI